MDKVKLSARRAQLPGKELYFKLSPFLPAGRQGPRLFRFGGTGHLPDKHKDLAPGSFFMTREGA